MYKSIIELTIKEAQAHADVAYQEDDIVRYLRIKAEIRNLEIQLQLIKGRDNNEN